MLRNSAFFYCAMAIHVPFKGILSSKLSKFPNTQKKVFHAFSFKLCSTANSKFSFYVSLCEINCIKSQTIGLVLILSILADILWVLFTLTLSFASDRKKVQVSWTFFSVARMKKKHVVLCNNWYWACSEILSYSRTTFSCLMEIHL